MCVCVFVCVYVGVCKCVYTYIYIYINIYIYIYIFLIKMTTYCKESRLFSHVILTVRLCYYVINRLINITIELSIVNIK